LRGALAGALLIAVWAGAAAGIVLTLAWITAPEWLVALLYVLLGWVGAAALPTLIATLGAGPPLGRVRPRRGWRASGRA
jgi:hemolysin III